jgi:predicted RNA-binding Zn ribbon-like protein
MIESEFRPVAGHLALDFVNTVAARVPADGRPASDRVEGERLLEPRDLFRWATDVGLLPPTDRALGRRRADPPPRALRPALEFRDALYRVFAARVRGSAAPRDDLAVVERTIQAARRAERLVQIDGGFRWQAPPAQGVERVLFPVALAAEALLVSPALERVRQCRGERCGWLFLDSSRNGTRRWCSMRDCGNLDKVRRFRRNGRR